MVKINEKGSIQKKSILRPNVWIRRSEAAKIFEVRRVSITYV
jgi:hypothetical protein